MQANSAKPGNAAVVPVKDLTKQELQAALLYGTIASCAYIDTEEEIRTRFDAFKTGELKGVPFKMFKATSTLWSTPLGTIKANTDTEVLCVRMPAKGGKTEMVVGFRGTETESAKGQVADVFTDLFALQSHISKMEGIPKDRYDKSVEVHRGFLASLNDVIHQTDDGGYDSMTAVREELFGKGVLPDRVVVCGHSLGGALATLGAFWLKSIMPSAEAECYAYASPRVGSKGFAEAFKASISKCLRFTHKNDIVAAVPASSAWSHVASPVLLLEPAKNTYGLLLAPTTLSSKYRAVKADRPRMGMYTSVDHHSLDAYLAAIQDVLSSMDKQ